MLTIGRLRFDDRMAILFQLCTSPEMQIAVVLGVVVLGVVVLGVVVLGVVMLNAVMLHVVMLHVVVLDVVVLGVVMLNAVMLHLLMLDTMMLNLILLHLLVLLYLPPVSNRLHCATAFEAARVLLRPFVETVATFKVACLTAVDAGQQSDGHCSEDCCSNG